MRRWASKRSSRITTRPSRGRDSWRSSCDRPPSRYALRRVKSYDWFTLILRRSLLAASAAVMLVVGLSWLVSAQAPSLTVVAREGRKPLPLTAINNQDYVAVDDINTTFGTTSREDRLAGGLTITARGRS